MLKVGLSRAGVIGQYNNLSDDASFISSADAFNHFAAAPAANLTDFSTNAPPSLSFADEAEMVKDTSGGFDLDITNKAWMLGRGFLTMPTMEYEARIGTIEASDVEQNARSGNPIADEGPVSVAVGGSFSGNIDFNGDTDDIRVFLVAGQTYHISLRGTGATPVSDTFLEVYNPSAALVNFDDDGGIGTNSMMTIVASATGNYTIRASSFSNPGDPGTGGYTVDVRVQGVDAVGDTNATAVVLNEGITFGFRETATVSGGADLDRYEVQLEAGKFYTFKLAAGADYATDYTAVPLGEIDTILRLRNAAGTLVAQNDDNNFPSDISSGFGFLATVTGTYYLDVTGYAGQTGGYAIEFENIIYQNEDPLQSIRWVDAANIPLDVNATTVNGVPTATVYFGAAGETFGEPGIVTFGWNATEKAAVMSALLEYTKITGITYQETATVAGATFRLNTVSTGNFGAYFYPQDPGYGAQKGIGIFNVNSGGWDKPGVSTQDIPGNQVSLDKGGFAYAVILHEFGHAHGLAHPHDNGGGSDVMLGVTAPTNSYGIFNLNQGVYTVMSYNDAWDFHPDGPSPFTIAGIGNGWSGTLGAFDIAALQERYGVHAYNTGNDVYTIPYVQQSGVYYSTIWDTGGNDMIRYDGTGRATIDLTAATLDYSPTGAGVLSFVDQIPGTAGVDGIFGGFTIANGVVIENASGGSGNDTLIGNAVANILDGGAGSDTMLGRGGNDTYVVDNAADVVIEAVNEGNDLVYARVSYALGASQSIETLSTSFIAGTDAIDLTGNGINNALFGNFGDNLLNGNGGADTMTGFRGNDVYVVDDAGDVVIEAQNEGTDTIFTSINYALGSTVFVENLAAVDSAGLTAISLTGNGNNNTLTGNNGANYLNGNGGADIMIGLGGNDTYVVDDAGDVVTEANGGGNDLVYTRVSYALGTGEIETLSTAVLAGTEAINLTGNGFNNTLIGNNGNNLLNGNGGADTMTGLAGDDTYVVDNAGDVVNEVSGEGNDLVFTQVSYTLAAGKSVETLSTSNNSGTGAINLTGNELANTLIGNFGVNQLDGKEGNDTLNGLNGADGFAFTTALGANNVDTIIGFVSGDDTIFLDDAIFTALGLGGLAPGAFVVGTAALDADDRIIYNSATGALSYDADGNGAGAAVQFATLNGLPPIVAADFIVI